MSYISTKHDYQLAITVSITDGPDIVTTTDGVPSAATTTDYIIKDGDVKTITFLDETNTLKTLTGKVKVTGMNNTWINLDASTEFNSELVMVTIDSIREIKDYIEPTPVSPTTTTDNPTA